MRTTLFFIPHAIGPLPVFGLGWALFMLVAFFALNVGIRRSRGDSWSNATADWMTWAIGAAVVTFFLPRIETTFPDESGGSYPVGLPIRGYGLMLMLGVVSAVGLGYRQAKQIGWSLDRLLSLTFATVVGGIVGARIFFVVQKWSELPGDTLVERLYEALKFTEGGLVVYGSIIGALVTIGVWGWWRGYGLFAVADFVVPVFLLGLAFGRIGCLLNGCCYGGICEAPLPKVTFPRGSLPYMDQLNSGELLGVRIAKSAGSAGQNSVVEVRPGSWADKQGLRPGQQWGEMRADLFPPAKGDDPAGPPQVSAQIEIDQRSLGLTNELPGRSLPTHPSQIYAAVNAALLSGFLFCLWPNVRRDGIVFGLGWAMYGVSRMIEEWIRIDEAGQFGTSLSIAQWISLGGIVAGLAILAIQLQKPPGRRLMPAH
jgi:phosphatidylglycerol:prolipoprotein diacylglycerol transferase